MENDRKILNNVVVLIPSLDPDEKLIQYVHKLTCNQWRQIVIVNDGSASEKGHIFEQLHQLQGVTVITHDINKGKGRALKTGFDYCMQNYRDCIGIVTADSDGQHSVKDVIKTAEQLVSTPDSMILGTRDFNQDNVPGRSRFGNKTTTVVFQLLYGKRIHDTQTGLRGIGMEQMRELSTVKGDRFEYEIRMLISTAQEKREIVEVPIETIYLDDNASSHFHPIKDSLRIYGVMFACFMAYLISSLSAALIDMIVFVLLNGWIFTMLPDNKNIAFATFGARVVSSAFNFIMNHKVVFGSNQSMKDTAFKYYGLVIIQMCCSAGLVILFTHIVFWNTILIKVIVDSILFLVSYQIQQHFVFDRK